MNEMHKLLKDTKEEYENAETESVPSGEWAEYNNRIMPSRLILKMEL